MHRRALLRAALAAALLASAPAAMAQAYPARPVTMVIPFPPGGTLDLVGRMIAQRLGEQMGQPFVVENRPGGLATIGPSHVAKAQPDGYTLLFNASVFTTTPMTMNSPPYDVVRDFTPIALVAKAPLAVALSNDVPAADMRALIAHAKANPGKMAFAIGAAGAAGHLATEALKRAAGIDFLIVPYKGTAPAFQDLAGGQIHGFIDPILGSQSLAKAGRIKVIAVTSAERVPSLPEVPTVSEALPGYEFYSWYGVWGPANLPSDIARRLNAEVNRALATAEVRDRLVPQGILLTPGSIDEFVRFQQQDMARSERIIKDANIRSQ
jgi:tripartite-type tricarboxylate transporter receptor subunit TctC